MRNVCFIVASLSFGASALAQEAAAPPPDAATVENAAAPRADAVDEIIVPGRVPENLRLEIERLEVAVYTRFNALNSNDEFDVYCHNERKYHSRATRRVCRARFESDASSAAVTDYFSALRLACGATVDCMFSERAAGAISASQAALGWAGPKRDAMTQEIWRLASEHEEFAQAIIDFYEMNQRYEAATSRRRDDD